MRIRRFLLFVVSSVFLFVQTAVSGDVSPEFPVLRVAQLCDPQLGFEIDKLDGDIVRLEKAVQKINELVPDMVVITGDLVNDPNDDEVVATFQKIIAQIKPSVLLTPGNHDLPDPVTTEGLQRYRSRFGEDFKVIECKGRCFISANSILWRGTPSEASVRHDRLLRDALQKAKEEGKPVVMLTHVPPFVLSVDEADGYYNLPKATREDILRLCNENGVILWLAGHTHKTAQRSHEQITLLNGETTSRNFDGHPAGFRLLTIHSDQSFDWDFISCEP